MEDPRAKPVPRAWAGVIDSWADSLVAGGKSAATIATRTDHLRRAARALGGDPRTVTPAEITAWVAAQTWSRETRRSVYASLRSFGRYLVEVGAVAESAADRLPTIRPAPPAPRPAPDPVIAAARRAADARVALILRLGRDLGMRRGEIAAVHASWIVEDLTGWSLRIIGKGGRVRVVPMTDELAAAVRAACLVGGGFAFPGQVDGHLSPRRVGKLATEALPGAWTLHTLRHAFATCVEADAGLIVTQQLLGHASVATTQRYVRPKDDRLRRAVYAAAS